MTSRGTFMLFLRKNWFSHESPLMKQRLPLKNKMRLTWWGTLCSSTMMGKWWQHGVHGLFDLFILSPFLLLGFRWHDHSYLNILPPKQPTPTSLYLLDDVNGCSLFIIIFFFQHLSFSASFQHKKWSESSHRLWKHAWKTETKSWRMKWAQIKEDGQQTVVWLETLFLLFCHQRLSALGIALVADLVCVPFIFFFDKERKHEKTKVLINSDRHPLLMDLK